MKERAKQWQLQAYQVLFTQNTKKMTAHLHMKAAANSQE
jgi:hypothetical protein